MTNFNHPISEKMEDIIKIASDSKEKSFLFYSDEQKDFLNQKENKEILEKIIDKEFYWFLSKNNINEKDVPWIIKEYYKMSSTYHKAIDKLKWLRNRQLNKIIEKESEKYIPQKDEKVVLFVPDLDQPIECEYDINLYISHNIFSNEAKRKYAELYFEYDLLISKKNLEMVNFYESNKIIDNLITLYNYRKEIYWKRWYIGTNKWVEILKKKKIKIEKENNYISFKKEIYLASLDNKKLLEVKNNFIKNYFRKTKYNNWYEQITWFLLETFYDKDENNDEFINKSIIEEFNKNDIYWISDKEWNWYIKEIYRTNMDIIKLLFIDNLKKNRLLHLVNYSYISDFYYSEKDPKWWNLKKERFFRLIEIQDTKIAKKLKSL